MRAVLIDDCTQFGRNMIECCLGRNRLKLTIFIADLRSTQSLGRIVRIGKLAAFDAGVTTEQRIIGVSAHGAHHAIFDIGDHRAIGVAKAAEGFVCGHHRPLVMR